MRKAKRKWVVFMVILGIAAVIDWIVPDPAPFIDELLLTFGALFTLYKTLA